MKSLPPNLQAIIAPMWIEASELPKRREIAQDMRKMLGLADDEAMPDPEKQQMAATIRETTRTVDELKKLNKMNSSDNTIRAGQKLRVSG